jgi:hypothetical protein
MATCSSDSLKLKILTMKQSLRKISSEMKEVDDYLRSSKSTSTQRKGALLTLSDSHRGRIICSVIGKPLDSARSVLDEFSRYLVCVSMCCLLI